MASFHPVFRSRTPAASNRRSTLRLAATLIAAAAMAGTGLASAAETASFEIAARDGKLVPERLEVPAGVKLRLTLRNEGKTPVEFENLDLRIEKVVKPNAASTVTVQPLKPGTYVIIDEFNAASGKMQLVAK